jgi:hypothetical protein
VFEAGVAVQMKTAPFRVLSSQSTQHPDIHVHRPSADALKRAQSLSAAQLARALGLQSQSGRAEGNGQALEIERRQLVIYKYEAHRVQRDAPPVVVGMEAGNGGATRGRTKKPPAARGDGSSRRREQHAVASSLLRYPIRSKKEGTTSR